jgi:hypothetical protein
MRRRDFASLLIGSLIRAVASSAQKEHGMPVAFFSGDEDQTYIDDLSHTEIYDVNTIANYDPDIIPYLLTKAPCAFEKEPGTHRYRKVEE